MNWWDKTGGAARSHLDLWGEHNQGRDGRRLLELSATPSMRTIMTKHRTPRAWLQEGRALQLPGPISDAFDDYVASLPWAGTTGLDWSRMPPSREFNVVGKSPADVYEWVKTTRVGHSGHVGIWYSRNEGASSFRCGQVSRRSTSCTGMRPVPASLSASKSAMERCTRSSPTSFSMETAICSSLRHSPR